MYMMHMTDTLVYQIEVPGLTSIFGPVTDFPNAMVATGLPLARKRPGLKIGVDLSTFYL